MFKDRTSLLALTALKRHDNYTFTHMVNVSILTMAQARALGIDGVLLREFGLAGLMHDIGRFEGVFGIRHATAGYHLLTDRGEVALARICLTHSFPVPLRETFMTFA